MHDEQLAYIEKLNAEQELTVDDVRALINEIKRLRYVAPIRFDMETGQERNDNAIMHDMLERFFTRWGPNQTIQLRVEFQADFHGLVQRIYMAAQAPFVKATADSMARQPMPPFFITKTEK